MTCTSMRPGVTLVESIDFDALPFPIGDGREAVRGQRA